MPKAKGKGGKNRRRGKNDAEGDKRELIFKEDGQEYAQVVKMLGNGRIEAKCQDGETRLGQIRGQMRKKVWIVAGDIILLSLRDFQDDRADVIHKYTADEARNLKTYGELKSDFTINEAAEGGDGGSSDEEGGGVEFEEADIDDICGCLEFRLMVVLTGLAESIPMTIYRQGITRERSSWTLWNLRLLPQVHFVSSSDTYPTLETGQALYTTMKHLTAAIWDGKLMFKIAAYLTAPIMAGPRRLMAVSL